MVSEHAGFRGLRAFVTRKKGRW